MKKGIKILINLSIYAAIVSAVVYGLPRFLSWSLKTPYPMAAITSGSMWPSLKEGDLVFIKGSLKKEDLKVSDIVVYRNDKGGSFTIHRIVKLSENDFTTKGDANFQEDNPIPYDRLIGRALALSKKPMRLPYLGSITVMANNLK